MQTPDPLPARSLNNPVRLFRGHGCLDQLPAELKRLGLDSALVVSDHNLAKAGATAKVEAALGDLCVATLLDVTVGSSPSAVEAGAAVGEGRGADCVVSVGGGSVMDTGKGVCVSMGAETPILEHVGIHKVKGRPLPHFCIPTTVGTGSEVSQSALFKDAGMGRQWLVYDEKILAQAAFLDPDLLDTLPKNEIARTGLDALSHALEALYSTWANPFSNAHALEACRLIFSGLGAGSNLASLQDAATLAGLAFQSAAVGLVHALSHVIGGRHSAVHGEINAVLLPAVLRYHHQQSVHVGAKVSQTLGFCAHAKTDEDKAHRLVTKVEKLLEQLGLPTKLSTFGVVEKALPNIAEESLQEPCLFTSPRQPKDADELVALLREVL